MTKQTVVEVLSRAKGRLTLAVSGSSRRKAAFALTLILMSVGIADPKFLQDAHVTAEHDDASLDEFDEIERMLAQQAEPVVQTATTADSADPALVAPPVQENNGVTLISEPSAPHQSLAGPALTLTIPGINSATSTDRPMDAGRTAVSESTAVEKNKPFSNASYPGSTAAQRFPVESSDSHQHRPVSQKTAPAKPGIRFTGAIVPIR